MIRQAHNYLAGAVSGTVLIAIAVAIFVMLVSVQAARDWPFADLVGGDDTGLDPCGRPGRTGRESERHRDRGARCGRHGCATAVAVAAPPRASSGAAVDVTATAPTDSGRAPSAGGGSPTATKSPSQSSGGNGSGGGGGTGGGEHRLRRGGKTSETATGATEDVVSGADGASGGAVGASGAGQVVEDTVQGRRRPESTVGGTVDKTVKGAGETVGGLLEPGD